MWILGGSVSGEKDLGYVAEQCPHCGQVGSCRVTGQYEGFHLYFVDLVGSFTQCVCTCGVCQSSFPGDLWRYGNPLKADEASQLAIDELIERTNPTLKDRLEHADLLARYQADTRFQIVHQSIDRLRRGGIRKQLTAELVRWGDLDEPEREGLAEHAGELANTVRFMESVAQPFSIRSGCLLGALVAAAIWFTFVWLPAVRSLGWGIVVGLAGLFAGMSLLQARAAQRAKLWTIDTCVPKGRDAGVNFQVFLALLKDLPPASSYSTDALRHLKEQENAIRDGLVAAGEIRT